MVVDLLMEGRVMDDMSRLMGWMTCLDSGILLNCVLCANDPIASLVVSTIILVNILADVDFPILEHGFICSSKPHGCKICH